MSIVFRTRFLRENQTQSEARLWALLRNRKMNNCKFLRQHPIKFEHYGKNRYFIADFFCAEKSLVIELDGKIHENQKEYDEMRTSMLRQHGLNMIRFDNNELEDIQKVLMKIKDHLV